MADNSRPIDSRADSSTKGQWKMDDAILSQAFPSLAATFCLSASDYQKTILSGPTLASTELAAAPL